MCCFLYIFAPKAFSERVENTFGSPLKIGLMTPEWAPKEISGDWAVWVITSRGCSCDLFCQDSGLPESDYAEEARKKYTGLGWSQQKIERAVNDSLKQRAIGMRFFQGLRFDVCRGIKFIVNFTGSLALLVHNYSGSLEDQEVRPKLVQPCLVKEFDERVKALKYDELLFVHSQFMEFPKRNFHIR